MMQTTKIERVRGVVDALPDDCELNRQITERLKSCFESFGYRPLDVPIIEHTDLYLRKSGEEIIDRLYDFVYRNRRLCLRPEMTASVMRAYIDNFQADSLPVRLHYAGPVFRYEKTPACSLPPVYPDRD
ncbi:ATP phosphoribosyltransferase regulatory subunit [Neosynechococcus sphagnicola]|uniref:ATP phosphoribosyltransferase regulatory subunit n=1 Tax=Neosynechococcus sphagnicola TaxID=1501145 RepID=UPI00138E31C8|nr:ATP phosphoribosyltransferase regulatory subunit [Neosynechococcus sphagnicola]